MTAATFALLTDGSTVQIQPARPQDADAVRELHLGLSPGNAYLRFFSFSSLSAELEGRRVCRPAGPDHVALLAWLGPELCGVASYELLPDGQCAEIAFTVPDQQHGRGVATLLLEHLVSIARQRGVRTFTAETLTENTPMLSVFAAAGLPVQRRFSRGEVLLTFPLPGGEADQSLETYLTAVATRESTADVASLSHLLAPASIAVVGASRRRGTPGREILHNLISGGFGGPVYAVTPGVRSMEGLRCLPSVAALPAGVDLAVLAVPTEVVVRTAAECGKRGVRSLVVVTADLGEQAADLLAVCRRYGMRLAGPNSFGVAVPGHGLNATWAAGFPLAGNVGVVAQSGGVGVSLLEQLSRLGVGVSSFAAVGDKYDVSSNDLLTWWERDGLTRLAVLYVESFGSPRKFARTARRVGRRMPVLTVTGARSAAGQRVAAWHTAAAPAPLATREALFTQAGVIATRNLGELVDAAALLASQPLPEGPRVAIVSNAGGPAVLATDACADHGLRVAALSGLTRRKLRRLLPAGASAAGPVVTTTTVKPGVFRACLETVAADDGADALLVVIVPTAVADLSGAVREAQVPKTLAAVRLNQPETVELLPTLAPPDAAWPSPGEGTRTVPAYADPEAAARALGHAARYQQWRSQPPGYLPELPGIRPDGAQALVSAFLTGQSSGGWLPSRATTDLLTCYGITVAAPSPDATEPGTQVAAGVLTEAVFGPVVVFAPGGTPAAAREHAARLTPLTDTDAASLIHTAPGAAALFSTPETLAADAPALVDLLLRIARLADDVPEIAEIDLSPIGVTRDSIQVHGARVRVSPAQPPDPYLRRLR